MHAGLQRGTCDLRRRTPAGSCDGDDWPSRKKKSELADAIEGRDGSQRGLSRCPLDLRDLVDCDRIIRNPVGELGGREEWQHREACYDEDTANRTRFT